MKNTDNRAAVKRSYSKFQRPSVSQVRPAFMEKMPGVNFKEKRGEPYEEQLHANIDQSAARLKK